jgi:pyrroline-5-carboxylate reductase
VSYDYGILGVGEIAEAIVTGLCEGIDRAPQILISPRNRRRAAALASRYRSVSVASENQSVVDRCPVVVLCVRPQDARPILAELSFRPDQAIVSVMAGVSHAELAPLLAPAEDVARAIPVPSVARRSGLTPVHPATEAARDLFDRLGRASVVDDVYVFEAMSAVTATISALLEYLAAISRWLSQKGVAPDLASRYVSSIFAGLSESLAEGSGDLGRLAAVYATPGGINERFAAMLKDAGTFELVGDSLETIFQDLQARS